MARAQLIDTFMDARLPAVLFASAYYFWRRAFWAPFWWGMAVYLPLHRLGLVGSAGGAGPRQQWPPKMAPLHRPISILASSIEHPSLFLRSVRPGQGPQPARFHPCRPERAARRRRQHHRRHPHPRLHPRHPMALDAGAAVMVTSHLGRPTEGEFKPEDSLAPWPSAWPSCWAAMCRWWPTGWTACKWQPGQVVLLENCRLNVGEKKNKEELAARWPRCATSS